MLCKSQELLYPARLGNRVALPGFGIMEHRLIHSTRSFHRLKPDAVQREKVSCMNINQVQQGIFGQILQDIAVIHKIG